MSRVATVESFLRIARIGFDPVLIVFQSSRRDLLLLLTGDRP